jgi:hypothetical protein
MGKRGVLGIMYHCSIWCGPTMWPEPCNDRPWTPANHDCRIGVCSFREFEPAVIPTTLIILSHSSVNI